MATKLPDAFLSYTRFDDQRERGRISRLRRELADEVRVVTGELFEIFQDVEGIGIGERWAGKLDRMLDQVRFFIPILTPSYFNSAACRDELEKFLRAETERGRNDLVLPIYYLECPVLEDPELRSADPLAAEMHRRQRHHWRKLRFSSFNTKVVKTAFHKLASEIVRARRRPMPEVTAPETSAKAQVSASYPKQTAVVPAPEVARTRRSDTSEIFTGVEYNGTKFKSSVEARWAVFFHTIGLKYEYERRVRLRDHTLCVPDFWLPDFGIWLEVKSEEPRDDSKNVCQRIADSTGCVVLMAVGAPEPRDQLLAFSPSDSSGEFAFPYQEHRFYFADDRRNEGEFWLVSDDGAAKSIGPRTGPDHGKHPGVYDATRRAYQAALNAHFERGEISPPVSVSPPDARAEGFMSEPISLITLAGYTKWKFPDLPIDSKVQRLLLRDLDNSRYKTIGDLDRAVEAASDAVACSRDENPEWFAAGTDYLTKSLDFADHNFRERHPFADRTRDAFVKYGHLVRRPP